MPSGRLEGKRGLIDLDALGGGQPELVHAVQYVLLGVTAFARLYTRGLLLPAATTTFPGTACCATRVPIPDRRSVFSVESEIAAWIACDSGSAIAFTL